MNWFKQHVLDFYFGHKYYCNTITDTASEDIYFLGYIFLTLIPLDSKW